MQSLAFIACKSRLFCIYLRIVCGTSRLCIAHMFLMYIWYISCLRHTNLVIVLTTSLPFNFKVVQVVLDGIRNILKVTYFLYCASFSSHRCILLKIPRRPEVKYQLFLFIYLFICLSLFFVLPFRFASLVLKFANIHFYSSIVTEDPGFGLLQWPFLPSFIAH